jgi:hypothetical protein
MTAEVEIELFALDRPLQRERPFSTAADRTAAEILSRLDDPSLSLTSLSASHRMSPRTLQLLFEQAGQIYSEFVLEHRLLRGGAASKPDVAHPQDHRDRPSRRLLGRIVFSSRLSPALWSDTR